MTTILALGDSLTAGYGLGPGLSFASKLEQALRHEGRNITVINGGMSGDTARDGLRRLAPLLRHKPDLVIVEFGANDLFMGLPVEEVKADLGEIIDACRAAGARVLLAGVCSLRGLVEEYDRRFHDLYQELVDEKAVPLVQDFMPGIPGNPELTLPDGIHPNEAGVDVMVANILPVLRPMLDARPKDVA